MPAVFVDTVAWIALLNRSDALRPRTLEVMATFLYSISSGTRAPRKRTNSDLAEVHVLYAAIFIS